MEKLDEIWMSGIYKAVGATSARHSYGSSKTNMYKCLCCGKVFTATYNWRGYMSGGWVDSSLFCPGCGKKLSNLWYGHNDIFYSPKAFSGASEAMPAGAGLRLHEIKNGYRLDISVDSITLLDSMQADRRWLRESITFDVKNRKTLCKGRIVDGDIATGLSGVKGVLELGNPFDRRFQASSLLGFINLDIMRNKERAQQIRGIMKKLRNGIRSKFKRFHGYDIGSLYIGSGKRLDGKLLAPVSYIATRLILPDLKHMEKALFHCSNLELTQIANRSGLGGELPGDMHHNGLFHNMDALRKAPDSVSGLLAAATIPDKPLFRKSVMDKPHYAKMLGVLARWFAPDMAVKEAQDSAGDLFEDLGDEPDDLSWAEKLKCNGRTGKVQSTRENIRLILTNDKHFKGVLGWDSFAQRIAMVKKASWRSADDDNPYWDDADDSQVRYLLETCYEIDSRPKIEDEVLNVASMHKFHPVRDFLNGLVWDHQPRMEKLFIDYLGAEDTPYVRAVTRKMLIAAVGRVMKPGLKFDNMVVLEGRQGLGKSYLLKKLGGKWFNDSLTTVQGKEAYEQLRGGWIYEMSELAALKKSEIEPVKQFVSKQVDSYRVAYGRRMSEFPRQCVFIGTTNESTFLRDSTGNRRFWPVSCGVCEPVRSLWSDESTEWIHQVWAEALEAYKGGETVWLGAELEQEAVKAQEVHMEENELVGMVAEFLDKPVPANWYELDIAVRKEVMQGTGFAVDESDSVLRDKVCLAEIWVEMMGGDMTRFDFHSKKRIADAMNQVPGWEKRDRGRFGSSYGTQRCWRRVHSALEKLLS